MFCYFPFTTQLLVRLKLLMLEFLSVQPNNVKYLSRTWCNRYFGNPRERYAISIVGGVAAGHSHSVCVRVGVFSANMSSEGMVPRGNQPLHSWRPRRVKQPEVKGQISACKSVKNQRINPKKYTIHSKVLFCFYVWRWHGSITTSPLQGQRQPQGGTIARRSRGKDTKQ